MKRYWIKLWLEILDDPKMARLPNHLWRRAIELFLLAGRNGNDGLLQPVEEMAWTLRLEIDKLLEDLHGLAEVGVVHETPQGWTVTHFPNRQSPLDASERGKQFRKTHKGEPAEKKNRTLIERKENEMFGGANGDSASASSSVSVSDSEGGGMGEGDKIPTNPAEAMKHPDIIVFNEVSGRIPGMSQYGAVIDTIHFLRQSKNLTYETAITYLKPYWLAWSTRKRADGKLYDPSNLTWLTEWAVNGSIPSGKYLSKTGSRAEFLEQLAEA